MYTEVCWSKTHGLIQGGLIAALVVEQHPSLISALLLSGPALDTIPAYGSFMAVVSVSTLVFIVPM